MPVDLEIRVPISPTPDFIRRVHFMAASLERLKASIGSYALVICVGGDVEPRDLYQSEPWSKNYPLTWHWADREIFRRDDYWETSRDIFRQPIRGRVVICADADVLFIADFSDLLHELIDQPVVAGVIAHVPPFQPEKFAETWQQLSAGYQTPPPVFEHEHTGWGFMVQHEALRYTPPYFNFGMVALPAPLMEIVSREIETADAFVQSQSQYLLPLPNRAHPRDPKASTCPSARCHYAITSPMTPASTRDTPPSWPTSGSCTTCAVRPSTASRTLAAWTRSPDSWLAGI